MEYGARLPMFAMIEMCAKDWGVPPWEVENAPLEYWERWMTWTSALQKRERQEAERGR